MQNHHTKHTPNTIAAALSRIPPNLPRDEWTRLGMAIKAEFSDEIGFDLFDTWSSAAPNYDARACRDAWKSFKPSGPVGIGTLLHVAKSYGFVVPKPDQTAPRPSPAELARREAQRQQAAAMEAAQRQAAHEAAAQEAGALWDSASTTGTSPYLERKGVQAHGLRFLDDGTAVVPLRDAAGVLWNVQRIAPQRPATGTDKLFLKGGRKSGLWHMLGQIESAAVVLVAEGYATCASLHQATGLPVAVAFDAGNLAPVAKALHRQYPGALLVLCADNDAATEARTGTNPGLVKAQAAAGAVGGAVACPPRQEGRNVDFNDLHQAQGVEAVATIVQGALAQPASQAQAQASEPTPPAAPTGPRPRKQRQAVPDEAPPPGAVHDRFFVVPGDGLYYNPPGDDGGAPRRVCGELKVVGLARNAQENEAAFLLEFVTNFGKVRRWLMPLTMLAGDGNAYRTALLNQGFMTPTDARRRAWLTEYLQSRPTESLELIRHVSRVGWVGRVYVLPNETIGTNPDGEQVIFHSEAGAEANFSQRGTLEKWQQNLSRLCVGNSRAAFAVATAFAGPLLAWASGVSGGGVHYVGNSSIGKTTCFLLAASVWGKGAEKEPDSFIQKWLATGNGLEYQAEQHSDCTLILDELGLIEPAEAGRSAYMLADGSGKKRAKGAGGLRPRTTWRLLFISSGELTLEQHMASAGQKQKAGQEVRLIPLPAEVREGSALECFHEFGAGHELSGWVQSNAARCYGVAGRAWLEYLVQNTDGLSAVVRRRMDEIEARLVPATASGQVKRGGRRFALIAAAAEMATEAGITGWPAGEGERAAKICFDAWLAARGGDGNGEVQTMLRQVRRFLELHGEGRFTWWHRAADDHNAKTLQRAGFRRLLGVDGKPIKTDGAHDFEYGQRMAASDGERAAVEFFILPETFKSEVCQGFAHEAVAKVLAEHQCLVADAGRYTVKPRLPGMGPARCYHIKPEIFALDL